MAKKMLSIDSKLLSRLKIVAAIKKMSMSHYAEKALKEKMDIDMKDLNYTEVDLAK
jgi:predicted HicB family RNase H-like nuclease